MRAGEADYSAVSIDFMSVSSYGGDTESSGVVRIVKDLDEPLADRHVIVIEDIVDSGRTLSYLLDMLRSRGLWMLGSVRFWTSRTGVWWM